MTDYLAAYGAISQQIREALEQMTVIKAKLKGRVHGPDRRLQEEITNMYRREVDERLQFISRLILELGNKRPKRFAVALSRLALNLGDTAEQMLAILYIPGYKNLLKVVLALAGHIERTLGYFENMMTQKVKNTSFNINGLLQDMLLAACPFRTEFLPPGHEHRKEVSFTEKYDEDMPPIVTDEKAFYLAFYQIICNAVEAAGNSGRVSVYSKHYDRFKQLQITISDTGPGIDREEILKSALLNEALSLDQAQEIRRDTRDTNNKMFELIYQPRVSAFAQTNQMHKGMGLTLAHEEITRHGGRIDIHSKPGRGSNFQVFFNMNKIQ